MAFFLALSPQTSDDFMSGFLCLPVAEPTGKELEKNVSIVPSQYPWRLGRGVPSNCDEPGLPLPLQGDTHSVSQDGLNHAAVTHPDPRGASHLHCLWTAAQLLPVLRGPGMM